MFIAMEAGIIKVVTATYTPMKNVFFIAMEAGITISNYCSLYDDESDACFIAMKAGISRVGLITATYPVMKMTRVSLQW